MIHVTPIAAQPADAFQTMYAHFAQRATGDYAWELPPLPVDTCTTLLWQGLLQGYMVLDEQTPIGFCLFETTEHTTFEIMLIHWERVPSKTAIDALMTRLLTDALTLPDWQVISYAMLGCQQSMVQMLPWYGFKPVGQAIVQFDCTDPVSVTVFDRQPVPQGLRLVPWDDGYFTQTAQLIFECFSTAADACWDPRLRSVDGAEYLLAQLVGHAMGTFLPDWTTVLLDEDDQVIGFCLMLETDADRGNIPLVGVKHRGRQHGLAVVQHSLSQWLAEGRLKVVSATLETDNWPAIALYRRLGFREWTHYPHVFLARTALSADKLRYKQWCQA